MIAGIAYHLLQQAIVRTHGEGSILKDAIGRDWKGKLSMNPPAASIRSHCLAPSRANRAIDAPLATTPYARMFPELPSFQADEEFLHALGRAGGLCDCGDV